ncbi:MAG: PD-(D/E)XK nuclease domain-containing protein [Deltaproteobacteria bacterium]|nr:PD-(D/E)XK nuclease domain-containing protein [Deltaproteobacteria bacterium]
MRIDAVIIALNQIKDKKYFEKYQGSGKEIYLFGVEFAEHSLIHNSSF